MLWKFLTKLFRKTQPVEEYGVPEIPVLIIYPDPPKRPKNQVPQFILDMRREWEIEQRRLQWSMWSENNRMVFKAA